MALSGKLGQAGELTKSAGFGGGTTLGQVVCQSRQYSTMKKSIRIKREFLVSGFGLLVLSFFGSLLFSNTTGLDLGELFVQGTMETLCGLAGLLGGAILVLGMILAIRARSANPVALCLECGMTAPSSEDRYCRNCGAPLTS